MLAINLSSVSFQKKVTALIMAGSKPADAVKEAIASEQAAQAIKAATALAKAAIFEAKVETEAVKPAPFALIERVRLEYVARSYAKSQKLDIPRYSDFMAMKVASAWSKSNWTEGLCFANSKTIEKLAKVYGL